MSVLGAILGAVGSTALSAGQGALGYGINELFGVRRHAQRQQLKQQDRLNALSFEWNKRQMDYAQQLEKNMYAYTFDMNRPEAIKNLIKNAGLNPALMYGNSAGISGTSVGGGRGAGYSSQAANEADIIQSNMAIAEMGLQLSKLRSEIDVNKSIAEKNKADAGLSSAKTKTEEQQRDAFISKLYYDGKLSWLESIMQKLKLTIGGSHVLENGNYNIVQDDEGSPKIYGGFSIPADISTSIFGREIISAVESSEALVNNYIANTALTNEKTRYLFMEVMAEIAQKNASAAESKARELQALWQIGEHVNWKTILESGVEAVNTIMNLLGTAYGSGMVKGLSNAPKSAPPRTVINNYNAPRNPSRK